MKQKKKSDSFSESNELSGSSLFANSSPRVGRQTMPDPFDQLKTAWKVFVRNWQQLILLTLIPMILTALLAILSFFMKWITYVPFDQIEAHASDYTVDLLGFVFLVSPSVFSNIPLAVSLTLLFTVLGTVVYLITSVAQLIVLKNDGKGLDFSSAINQSFTYLWKYFVFMILYSLVLVVGLILLVIPGIIFLIWFGLGYLAIVFDDYKTIEAFKRSKELVKGYWWAIFGRFVFWSLFSLLIGFLIFLLRIISGSDYVAIISNLVSLVITPLSVAYFAVVYQDIKSIKEK